MIRIILLLFVLSQCLSAHSQTPLRIVCMGNSITQGKVVGSTITEKSYRLWLWEKLDSAGVAVDMVGYLNTFFTESATNLLATPTSRYTGKTFDRDHDSYYGINSTSILQGSSSTGWTGLPLPKLSDRLKNYTPDIALLHIGTNDPDNQIDQTEANIKGIIDAFRVKNPKVIVFLAKTISSWKAVNGRVDKIASDKTTLASPVIAVDLATGFIANKDAPNTMTLDGLHPNERGQKFMADRWYAAIMKQRSITSTIANAEALDDVSVYPTLTDGMITVANASNSKISLLNTQGHVINTIVMAESDNESISLLTLESGMYFIQIEKQGVVTTRKVILEK